MRKISKGIYCIENIINGKKYIGSSLYIEERITTHKRELKNNSHSNSYLQNAYNKYGVENFKFYILEKFDKIEEYDLRKKEEEYFKTLKSMYYEDGYNINEKTNIVYINEIPVYKFDKNGNYICKYESIKIAAISNNMSIGNIQACCEGLTNYAGDYIYKKCLEFKEGQEIKTSPLNEKQKNISIYDCPKKYNYDFTQADEFLILCYSLRGKLIYTFDTVSDASNFLNLNKQTIFNRLKENNRLSTLSNPKYRIVKNYIFIRINKNEKIENNIKTNLKFLQKIDIKSGEILKEYDYECRKDCAKEENITLQTLDRHIKKEKPINDYLYKYKFY